MALELEQAIGQKLLLSFEGKGSPQKEFLARLRRQQVGGVTLFRSLNVENPAQVRALTGALQQAAAEAGQARLLVAADQEGGQLMAVGEGTTPFPGGMALGATRSADLAYKVGYAIGRELAAMGINVNYAPVCDVNVNPYSAVVGTRAFGEEPQLVAELSAAMATGIQAAGVAATAKHFPGHGDTTSDSHFGMPVLQHDEARLHRVELPPFAAAVQAGVRLVMTAHIALPALHEGVNVPATLSAPVLRGILREELGFEGVIVSDAMDMRAIRQGAGLVEDAVRAVEAGVDLLLLNHPPAEQERVYTGLVEAVQRGDLSGQEVLASAERVLRVKRWLDEQTQPELNVVGCNEHQALAGEVATEALTLVRDEAGMLPLRLDSQARIAAILPQPQDLTPADTSSYVKPALASALRKYHAHVDEIILPLDPGDEDVASVRQRSEEYDLIVVGTINATAYGGQAALVNTLLQSGVPTLAVAMRLPYDLRAYPTAPTYICTYSVLPSALQALASALWGEVPFRGRLPVTIPEGPWI